MNALVSLGTSFASQSPVEMPIKNSTAQLPHGFLPFEEFSAKFNLGQTSTEKSHEATKRLSEVAKHDIESAIELLLTVDKEVLSGFRAFMPLLQEHTEALAKKIAAGGRVFFVGSGSSGRVGVDIAAKCNHAFSELAGAVRGLLAGGDSTLIKPKENFEDSELEGRRVLESYDLHPEDTVVLLSASGSATFNEGCGHFAADCGANVLYFYNSKTIPERTQKLFLRQNNPVKPLCIDIGPQAIAGSTRLQAATLAEACLGALVTCALYKAIGSCDKANEYPTLLLQNMQRALELIKDKAAEIAAFCQTEVKTFSNPHANFRREKDSTNIGYVTFVAEQDSMREVLIDTTETSPTFSTNPILRESEKGKKRAEFCAYLLGEKDNQAAWKALLGRDVAKKDLHDTEQFLLAKNADGIYSYANRPVEQGNFVIGVAKLTQKQHISAALSGTLINASRNGADTGLILLSRDKMPQESITSLSRTFSAFVSFDEVPYDEVGFSETILLKETLNLISNISMVLMGKVEGNLMIDVRAANKKLIDRCIRLVKAVWEIKTGAPITFTDEELYYQLAHIFTKKEVAQKYTPSPVKIMLQMLAMKKTADDFELITDVLKRNDELIAWGLG